MSGAYNDPLWHFTLSFHFETTQHSFTQHSSSAFDLLSQCALCRDRRGIYTEQACGSGSAEGQLSLISFPMNHSTFPPSRLLPLFLSYFIGMREMYNKLACSHVSLNLTSLTDGGFSRNVLYMLFSITLGGFTESMGATKRKEKE